MEKANEDTKDSHFVGELRYSSYYIPNLLRFVQPIVVGVQEYNDIKGPNEGCEAGGVSYDHGVLNVGESASPSRLTSRYRLRCQCHLIVYREHTAYQETVNDHYYNMLLTYHRVGDWVHAAEFLFLILYIS